MAFFSKVKSKLLKQQPKDIVLEKIEEVKKDNTEKYSSALFTSRESFTKKIQKLITKHREIDEEYFEDLEEVLITADVGAAYAMKLIEALKTEVRINKVTDINDMNEVIFEKMFGDYLDGDEGITKLNLTAGELNVILVIGVNGVGKTTSIGKLSKKFKDEGYKVSLAAADTFRAGAVAQLAE